MTGSTLASRAESRRRLTDTVLDVLVLGGGITGSGIARDASLRGLTTGLVEQYDFAFGTSSRSSRLLHGGLRYLEQGRLRLVREASLEKQVIRHIAPHLAEPLGFIFPAYAGGTRPLWQLRLGVKLYDLLCSGRNFEPSRGFTRAETLAHVPELQPHGLQGAVRYFDALTQDARLVLDTLRSAVAAGATVSNYVRFRDARRAGSYWECEFEDRLTQQTFTGRALALVNATGPWAPQVPHSAVQLRLSKGIHLVVDRERLPAREAVVLTRQDRILFVIPWGERVILGTTDTDYEGAAEAVRVEAADVTYLLRAVNEAFPSAHLTGADVLSAWAGLRPLVAKSDGAPSDLSRAHQITTPEPGWWDVTGGKLTTYRLMAEQAVDQLAQHLGRRGLRCRTHQEPLLPTGAAGFSGILPPPCTREAVTHYVEQEWAIHLSDVMLRRSGWHCYHAANRGLPEQVAQWMAPLLGWTDRQQADELAEFRSGIADVTRLAD